LNACAAVIADLIVGAPGSGRATGEGANDVIVGVASASFRSPPTIDARLLELRNQLGQSRHFRFESANAEIAAGVRAVCGRQSTRRTHRDYRRFRKVWLVHD
jgi:hypothetical protein